MKKLEQECVKINGKKVLAIGNWQVFLKFIEFVNKMVYFSSTEGTDGLVFSSGGRRIFNFICGLDNDVKGLEGFLEEAGIKTALVPFEEVLLSGMEALVILYFWYVQRKDFSFVFIDSFDAFYHTFLSRAVIWKLAAERNIQIIFTSHNTSIISNRRSEERRVGKEC